MYQFLIAFLLVFLTSTKVIGQDFDSLHVYAVYMNSMYRVRMTKELIKDEVAPIILKAVDEIDSIKLLWEEKIKRKRIKKLQSNYLDIRISFEFFKGGKVVKEIGVTRYNTFYIDYTLFSYEMNKLKLLEEYLPGLSKTLGIK